MGNRYPWWGYVRYMVQQYPELVKNCHCMESIVDSKNYGAVRIAIECTERMENSVDRLMVICMVHWDRTHTLEGAALSIPCSRRTAAYWQREFFEEVARNRGLLD